MATLAPRDQEGMHSFFDKLAVRAEKIDSLLCVGLDPHAKELGDHCNAAGARAFCSKLIASTSSFALAYKPNSAFFEEFGSEGIAAMEDVIASVPDDIPVILDVKRGDIGSTAAAYASAAFKGLGAHCVTLNPYMGEDTVQPFIKDPAKGAFVLCKTSNPSSRELQSLPVGCAGKSLFEQVASLCERWNSRKNVGLVVGATDVDALARARASAPNLWILAPGVGAQGGNLEAACEAAFDSRGLGIILPVSRGISTAEDPRKAAAEFRDRINAVRKKFKERRMAANDGARGSTSSLLPYQREFIEFALNQKVLKFGKYTLKSGRESPYFFNAGLFDTGGALSRLAGFYSEAIVRAEPPLEFDVIFGPAYKGIPLGASVAMKLADLYGRDVGFAYNRKEAKDHGDKGLLVGASLKGKRILILDDVITAGTAIRESMGILKEAEGTPAGVVVALDRQERTGAGPRGGEGGTDNGVDATNGADMSAVQHIQAAFGIPVVSVVGLSALTSFMAHKREGDEGADPEALKALKAYRLEYGVE